MLENQIFVTGVYRSGTTILTGSHQLHKGKEAKKSKQSFEQSTRIGGNSQ